MYAIVDIETTGSYAAANGITEIAIHVYDGERVVEKYETLVNPLKRIPKYIQSFTGITDEMVADAPLFSEIAPRVFSLLENNVFVAHNVNFDYSFVKAHLAHCGFNLQSKKLCTVRLGRKIFPNLPSYSLGNLCRSLNITIRNRHRAGGDTEATVEVFKQLLAQDQNFFINGSLMRTSREHYLPPNVPKEDFDKLPYGPGVYYFHDQKGKVIYVGKARSIRQRVSSHFSNNSESRQKQNFILNTHSITFTECATELMACILESAEIKKYWPQFNYSQKRYEEEYGIFDYEDRNGYLRLGIEKTRQHRGAICSFHYLSHAHGALRRIVNAFNLCPKLCFIHKGNEACPGLEEKTCFGACESKESPAEYNLRVEQAMASLGEQPSFAILDRGIQNDERSCILVLNGKLYGMGYLPGDEQVSFTDNIKDYLKIYRENSFIRNMLYVYKDRNPSKVIMLS